RARQPERNQERRSRARALQTRQDRGPGARDQAAGGDHDRWKESLPGGHPDPLGLRRRLSGRGPTKRRELAGQRPDAIRRRCERLYAGVQGLPREPGEDLMQALDAILSATPATDPWPARRQRTDELASRYPHAADILRLYRAVLDPQEEAFRAARADGTAHADLPLFAVQRVLPGIIDATIEAGPPVL